MDYKDQAQQLVATNISKVKTGFDDTLFNAMRSFTSLRIVSNTRMEQV
jgi:hypothetical protein